MKNIKEKIIIFIGVWLLVLPSMGFPSNWKSVFMVITGVVSIYVGLLMYRGAKKVSLNPRSKVGNEIKAETFTETS